MRAAVLSLALAAACAVAGAAVAAADPADPALMYRAIEAFLADPADERSREKLVTLLADPDEDPVGLALVLAPLVRDRSFTTLRLAYLAGSARAGLDSGAPGADPYSGVLALLRVYRALQAADPGYAAPHAEALVSSQLVGGLQAWLMGGGLEPPPGAAFSRRTAAIIGALRSGNEIREATPEGEPSGAAAPLFADLVAELRASARRDEMLAMLEHESGVVRALGMAALAETEGRRAEDTLRSQLAARIRVRRCPGDGGPCTSVSLGALARERLLKLLPRRDELAMEVGLLAGDRTADMHEDAAATLEESIASREISLDLALLRKLCPGLEPWQIVKGAGRMRLTRDVEAFLVRCLGDRTLDATSRLAAASALTRASSDLALAALRRDAGDLDRASGTKAGVALLAEFASQREWRVRVGELARAADLAQERALVLDVFRNDHPYALPQLRRTLTWSITHDDDAIQSALTHSLLRLSAAGPRFAEPWNTHSDLPYHIEQLAALRADALGPALTLALRRNVAPQLAGVEP